MTSIKFLGAALVLSALVATPASAGGTASEPAAALAQDPTYSIYSNAGAGFSRAMASQVPLRRVGAAHVGTAASRKSHFRRQALLNPDFEPPAFLIEDEGTPSETTRRDFGVMVRASPRAKRISGSRGFGSTLKRTLQQYLTTADVNRAGAIGLLWN